MTVRVRLFAGLRERAGWAEREVDAASLADVWPQLGLGDEPPGLLYAVNREYAERSRSLADGDEVALIPPVSGGAFRLSEEPLSLDRVVDEVRSDEAGAIATFTGTTREQSRGRSVVRLDYEAYEGMAEQVMTEIAEALHARYALTALAIHHRIGTVGVGEPSVVIAVSAPHRGDALAACRDAIDELKERVPLWKKEVYSDGEEWIGEGIVSFEEPEQPEDVKEDIWAPRKTEVEPEAERGYDPIQPHGTDWRGRIRKAFGPVIAVIVALAKFSFVLLKFSTIFIAVAAYALIWGWKFAIGVVVLIFIHEIGHYIEAKREGLSPKLPIFVPFLGAYVRYTRGHPWQTVRVAIAGPILGGVASFVCYLIAKSQHSNLMYALAYFGFFINLFNLVPFGIFDGGQVWRSAGWLRHGGAPRLALASYALYFATALMLILGMVASHVTQHRL